MENKSVLQSWVVELPLRMQATLILGLRGPDTGNCPGVKQVTRWLRGLTFKPGNPFNADTFMGEMPGRIVEKSSTAKELEFCTQHFYSHLMHSLQVVGHTHPDPAARQYGFMLYIDMCELMHLSIENSNDFRARLRQIEWPGGVQPDNFIEAMEILQSEKALKANAPKGDGLC